MKKNFMGCHRKEGENVVAYKDEKRGTWYVSFHYNDWTGKDCRKVKEDSKPGVTRQNGRDISA